MFFLFRCCFWLTVVFTSMSWLPVPSRQGAPSPSRQGAGDGPGAVLDSGLALAGTARDAVIAKITAEAADATGRQIHALIAQTVTSASPPPARDPTPVVRAWCTKDAAECHADAARLTALVMANQTEDSREGSVPATSMAVPLPPRRPRAL